MNAGRTLVSPGSKPAHGSADAMKGPLAPGAPAPESPLPSKSWEPLARHLGVDAARKALADGDLAALCEVPGITPRKAADLVRQANGTEPALAAFLGTPQARKLLDDVLDHVAGYAATAQGRDRLRLLAPAATPAKARDHIRHVLRQRDAVAKLDRAAVRGLLKRIHLIRRAPPRLEPDRLLVADDDETERLRALGVTGWVSLGSPRALATCDPDTLVLLVGEGPSTDGLDAVADLPEGCSLAEAAPEAILAQFHLNRSLLEAMRDLAALTGRASQAGPALTALLQAPPPRPDARSLRQAAEAVRGELDQFLQAEVAGLHLSGADLLATLGKRLPPPLQAALDKALAEGRRRLQERVGLDLNLYAAGFPLVLDEDALEAAQATLDARGRLAEFHARAKVARTLAPLLAPLETEARSWLAFDADFALGCFAFENGLQEPAIADHLEIEAATHMSLWDNPEAAPIAYELGRDANVAVLTGANSGGKTTLLEHVGQMVILARLGLPVHGTGAVVPWVEELHYVTARRSLDAGAFESFLRSFLPLSRPGPRRLVLADEVESVTELEAAGRILGFFLDRMAQSGSLAIVVSHLAPQILQHSRDATIRVDGIEATGLDEKHRLIVDRTPRMGLLARSTPELIVQRLAATATGDDARLYGELLAALQSPVEAPLRATPRRHKPSRREPASPPT